jgi:hypothetical protein
VAGFSTNGKNLEALHWRTGAVLRVPSRPGQCTTLLPPPLCGTRARVRPPCSPRFLPVLKTFKARTHADLSFNSPRILLRHRRCSCSLLVLGVFSARLQPLALSSKWFFCVPIWAFCLPQVFSVARSLLGFLFHSWGASLS